MGLLEKLRGVFTAAQDEPEADQRKTFEYFCSQLTQFGSVTAEFECDELPRAEGPFGQCATNPIPVNGIQGEMVYMNTLRSRSGSPFFFHRLGSVESPISPHPVDHYEMVACDASEWLDLFFSIYFPRRSRRTPDGYRRTPWSDVSPDMRPFLKLPFQGTNKRVDEFPLGLPGAIVKEAILGDINSKVPGILAKTVQEQLDRHSGHWGRPCST